MKPILFIIFISSINISFGQTKSDKIVNRLKNIYLNIKTYSELGQYVYTSRSNDEYEKIMSKGNHILYFDNTNKKIQISAKTIDSYTREIDSTSYNFLCKIDDKEDNIFLAITKMSNKQDNILTTINRHNFTFFASNPNLNYYIKKIFEDTIQVITNEEKLEKVKCYKLSRRYNKPLSKKLIEAEKKEKQIWDSLGRSEEYNNFPKRIVNTDWIEETYWFRKNDGMLLKEINVTTIRYDNGKHLILKTERTFEPMLNPVMPPIFWKEE